MNLDELEALCNAATPGKWRFYDIHGPDYGEVFGPCGYGLGDRVILHKSADAAFIAAARSAMPKLLAVARAAANSPHEVWCETTYKPPNPCNCWRSDISAELAKLEEP